LQQRRFVVVSDILVTKTKTETKTNQHAFEPSQTSDQPLQAQGK